MKLLEDLQESIELERFWDIENYFEEVYEDESYLYTEKDDKYTLSMNAVYYKKRVIV